MKADQVRSRSVGCKVTEEEYAQLAVLAERGKKSMAEWCREVLVDRIQGRDGSVAELSVLGEVLSLRTIVLNVHYDIVNGKKINEQRMREIIDRADNDKLAKAARRLREVEKTLEGE